MKEPRLDLPVSKGWVEFRDYDEVSGAMYRRIRASENGESRGEQINNMTLATAAEMIEDWNVPTRPGLLTPQRDRKALDRLPGRDLYLLEKVLLKIALRILEGNEDDDQADEETGETPLPVPAAG